MKMRVETIDRRRRAVAGAIGNDDAAARRKRRDRPIERIDLVSPAAVEKQKRRALSALTVVDAHGRDSRRQRRGRQFMRAVDVWLSTLPPEPWTIRFCAYVFTCCPASA